MKIINSNGGDNPAGNKDLSGGRHIRSVIKLAFVFVIIVLCFGGVVFFVFISPATLENKQEGAAVTAENSHDTLIASDDSFADCKPLQENCAGGIDCAQSSICGEGVYETCKIYDCGDTYGVYTKSGAGGVSIYEKDKQEKSDESSVQPKQGTCKGLMVEVLEQECVDSKMQVKVNLATEGECKIDDFIILYGDKENQPNTFVSLGKNIYSIEVKTCGGITDIIPRTKGGVSIF